MKEQLIAFMVDVMIIMMPFLAAAVAGYLLELISKTRLARYAAQFALKQEWAYEAVKAAQQTFSVDLHAAKYNAAAKWISVQARDYGIKISPDETQLLIEATIKALKKEFKEEWKQLSKKEVAGFSK